MKLTAVSSGFTHSVLVLTSAELHTAFCQTSPSQCELYPCVSQMKTFFRKASNSGTSSAFVNQTKIHVLNSPR